MIRVLVVDDHDFFRACLIEVIAGSEDLSVVGECRGGDEVSSAVRELAPHVVLMDVRMGATSGTDAAAALQREGADARVIMLTSDLANSTRVLARASGAAGFLLKGHDADKVVDAVRRVAAGGTAWPEDLDSISTVRSDPGGEETTRSSSDAGRSRVRCCPKPEVMRP